MPKACPVCKENTMSDHDLEANLHCHKCSKCDGVWIGENQYDKWLHAHGESLPEKAPEEGISLQSGEFKVVKFCPDCKFILMKYKVGHQLPFSLNRCNTCSGVWFDKNEWEILKSRNLHLDVHKVFSQSWQSSIFEEEHQAAMKQIWLEQFGEADLKEIQRIKLWLDAHPKSAELYAFLLDPQGKKTAAVSAKK